MDKTEEIFQQFQTESCAVTPESARTLTYGLTFPIDSQQLYDALDRLAEEPADGLFYLVQSTDFREGTREQLQELKPDLVTQLKAEDAKITERYAKQFERFEEQC